MNSIFTLKIDDGAVYPQVEITDEGSAEWRARGLYYSEAPAAGVEVTVEVIAGPALIGQRARAKLTGSPAVGVINLEGLEAFA
jgi:hypothetical protein